MHNNHCPFCKLIENKFDTIRTNQQDIIYSNYHITIFLASDGWPNNMGHLLIIPNKHFKDLYNIPDSYLHVISSYAKKCALLLKEVYQCDGVTIRQNNEVSGGQDVFHYHMHIFPRYENDYFNHETRIPIPEAIRKQKAKQIKSFLNEHIGFFDILV